MPAVVLLNTDLNNVRRKSFTMDVTTAAAEGAPGFAGEMALTNGDIENARAVIPQYARKPGYNYSLVCSYEGNVLRVYSPVSLTGVTVGVVLFF
jgi:hypothetical protein